MFNSILGLLVLKGDVPGFVHLSLEIKPRCLAVSGSLSLVLGFVHVVSFPRFVFDFVQLWLRALARMGLFLISFTV